MEKPKLTKSQKILFIVLAIVLAYAIFDFITHKETYIGFYSGETGSSAEIDSSMQKANLDSTVDVLKMKLTSHWGEDPFFVEPRPVVKKSSRKKKREPIFILKAISFRPEGSVALINDRIIKEGDVIQGYKVIKISEKSVILWNGKKRKVLKLTNM